ncbi:hypothetical protein PUNSTDRAFT_134316 [Punctularia strigosozonata HHB-11173 SS5]|uniref:uncharacterized protein n=1 Tax=Punctularia strigosozonata (strain HHB-11173) TaxID=741275 RepID=UPI00044175EE|nr:uncharacterized protein PUNSTDRAFT_134316 [Punctularia strigosozonata HHB-11173 SS5]EIN09152.1 hypothetical protein PUNSTDRAFT_134316 [Punctularia strigosozonata HHB-11173 SS5]
MAPKTQWSDKSTWALLDSLKASKTAGLASDNGWKPGAWTVAAATLEDSEKTDSEAVKSSSVCWTCWGTLKKEYEEDHILRDLSGFEWDDDRLVVVATNKVWEAYLVKHPSLSKWKKKAFSYFDEVAELALRTVLALSLP